LIVGGIGIMNTMYTSVLERTREIGIMKSIGAKNSDILTLFLIESGILGLVGGGIGIILGIGFSKLVEAAAKAGGYGMIQVSFPLPLIIGTLMFSFVVGALSGILPARQASKLQPVDALRYE
ncbi:MAG: ABC transporter permease, partial [Nanoarchaeota archaeon]|nr:ABC transporter permease [Nanoarchaeota archaeon]